MDIVNRTKKVGGGSDTPRVTRRVSREEPMDEAVDTVRVVKPARDLDGESKSIFAGKDAINKFLNKSKEPKKTEKKKTTETKKKTTAKKEPSEKRLLLKKWRNLLFQ